MADTVASGSPASPQSVRWNFFANLMDGALFSLAMSFVSQQTVLPVFVRKIGGGNISVGLIPVLWLLGFNFPQILIAGYVQRQPWKKPLLLKTAMWQRIPWLLLAVVPFTLFAWVGTDLSLFLFFFIYTLAAVGGSINLPVWFDLIAKLTPVTRRGRLFGSRSILGSLLGIAGGGIATYVLAEFQYPVSFSILLSLTFVTMMVSYLFLVSLREEIESVRSSAVRDIRYVLSLPQVLRSHPNYRNFLVADALLISSTMAAAFYTVHAFERFGLTDAYAGAFTMIMMVGTIVGSLIFGVLADRFGHRVNMQSAALATTLACLLAVAAPCVEFYGLVFVLSAVALTIGMISRLPFLAEICPESERPTMVALANMVTSPFVLWGVVAGWMADALGYSIIFILAAVFSLTAFLWTSRMVAEPRRRTHQQAPGRNDNG